MCKVELMNKLLLLVVIDVAVDDDYLYELLTQHVESVNCSK